MSLLTLIQSATDKIGLTRPSVVYASTDQQVRELLSFANQEGVELAHAHQWQEITKEKTFTCTAAAAQTGAFASDYDRVVNDSMFNRTAKRKVIGPIGAQEWQERQAYTTASGLNSWFRLRGDSLLMTPTPNGTDTIAYEYISTQWCESSVGTDQSAWAADTDVGLLDENLMSLGVVWRWLKANGFPIWELAYKEYQAQVSQAGARQMGAPILNIGQRAAPYLRPNVPEASFGP